jgi:hypothetical protein
LESTIVPPILPVDWEYENPGYKIRNAKSKRGIILKNVKSLITSSDTV